MMKKVFAALLALSLAFSAVAFAQGDLTEVWDFGDFTIRMSEDTLDVMDLDITSPDYVKTSGVVIGAFYPAASQGDYSSNLNFVWVDDYEDFSLYTEAERESFAQAVLQQGASGMTEAGIHVSDSGIIYTMMTEIDSMPVMNNLHWMDLYVNGATVTMYQETYYIGTKEQGMYALTLSTADEDVLMDIMEPIVYTIDWRGDEAVDFVDFTLDIDPDMEGTFCDGYFDVGFVKPEGEVLFTLYPESRNGDTSSNLNCVWSRQYMDIASQSRKDFDDFVTSQMDALKSSFTGAGYDVQTMELLGSEISELDGAASMSYALGIVINVSGQSLELYQEQVYASTMRNGTYIFTMTTSDPEVMARSLEPILETLRWK